MPYFSYRLLSFHISDAIVNTDEETGKHEREFQVQMFGINEKGNTAAIFVKGYTPFFFVKVGDNWGTSEKNAFVAQIRKGMGDFYENSIKKTQLIQKKKLYGFDGGKEHTFMEIHFDTEAAMRKAKSLWYTSIKNGTTGEYKRVLTKGGFVYDGVGTELYEAQIPPLLRMFHIQEISPSGWISLPVKKTLISKTKKTSCNHEYVVNYKDIKPLPNKETRVPYKIASFDIEASSSHGDFPLAKKNYKKLATNIVDVWNDERPANDDTEFLRRIIYTAFEVPGYNQPDIDVVFPQNEITSDDVSLLFDKWVVTDISKLRGSHHDEDIGDDVEEDEEMEKEHECEEGAGSNGGGVEESGFAWASKKKPKSRVKKGTIIDILNDKTLERESLIYETTKCLDSMFPNLKGDEVTFIGTTFLKYGDGEPYMNHCIVRDTCAELPQVKNSVIESYDTERDVMLAWTDLIQREDPDVIIGYNIFGFDYHFMYLRAKELDCVQSFLRLSRNRGEVCLNKDWRTGKEGLEENTLFIASGQHDLKFVNMTGRLQVDLYNYLRRDYQLIKYKLDYVAGYFIGDSVKKIEHIDGRTKIYSKNLTGLESSNFVNFEEEAHSVDSYKDGKKFEVSDVDAESGTFWINSIETPDMTKKVRWGLAKDDVTPQDIFRMTNEGPQERSVIAKYCIQDCNLVHHLMNKIDVITDYIEMGSLCSVPMDFLVMRGQGIKLTSYIAKKCREKNTLMPVIDKLDGDDGYEGAIVLDPKCDLYLEEPVACVDYSSLYPSSMISENISHDSKVWTKEYNDDGRLVAETGEKDSDGNYIYDNLDTYKYVDVTYDTYKWRRKNNNPKAAMEKVKVGYKTCRFAQFPDGKKGVMPAILEELLAARKATRKLIPKQTDDFMKNVLDKRQLSIKVTANSMYGQTGAKTSSFYEKDCAASTTATGRKLLTYARRVIEEAYADRVVQTLNYGKVKTDAEYVYGDTDSVFFKFNLKELDGTPIIGQKALEITIELAKEAGKIATMFLKKPHDLEYEKTFLPFCLLSKKRYVGMLYEDDPHKCKRKSMGIVLKRRDNAPIVKDVYGGVIDILMKDKDIEKAAMFMEDCLQNIVDEKYGMDKLVITKSLRSGYKNPKQIAHKVLADRIGKRDPGNKPSVGDRVAYIYIVNPDKKALQGDRIETPEFICENNIKINYSFYITNQLMKPLQQVFALVLEQLPSFRKKMGGYTMKKWKRMLADLRKEYPDYETYKKKEDALRNKEVKSVLFDEYLRQTKNAQQGFQSLNAFYKLADM